MLYWLIGVLDVWDEEDAEEDGDDPTGCNAAEIYPCVEEAESIGG
jgi:hypothetical protein